MEEILHHLPRSGNHFLETYTATAWFVTPLPPPYSMLMSCAWCKICVIGPLRQKQEFSILKLGVSEGVASVER
jgi:hypothetical protein